MYTLKFAVRIAPAVHIEIDIYNGNELQWSKIEIHYNDMMNIPQYHRIINIHGDLKDLNYT